MNNTIIRLKDVAALTGLAHSTIYLRIKQGLIPHPISLGIRAVGWPAHEIYCINKARIAGANDEQIRQLVLELEARRSSNLQQHLREFLPEPPD